MSDTPDRDQKTESPSAKRRADAARDGDVLQSREWATGLMMIAGAAWIMFAGPWFVLACADLIKNGLSLNNGDVHNFDPAFAVTALSHHIMLPLASLFAITMLAAVAAPAALGSLGFRTQAIGFKPSRLNPLAGLKRIFGMQGVIELAKAIAKAGVLAVLGYAVLKYDLPLVMGLSASAIKPAFYSIGTLITHAVLILALGLGVISAIDVPIQMIRRNARLRMTKQEVKQEMRESEGSPELKQAQRQRQHAILSGSARKAVSEATVILTNPTHFAIALRYRPGIDAAPVVAARGRGDVALAIRAMAKDHGVPTLEYPQLTRALYFTSRAGNTISQDLFIAVATILAFVFNLERAVAQGVGQPSVLVPTEKCFDEHGKRRDSERSRS
jgi:flagellar biosynthesis protein FlhB